MEIQTSTTISSSKADTNSSKHIACFRDMMAKKGRHFLGIFKFDTEDDDSKAY